ncbi:MAG: PadR family transcriptional regulator [Alphaproteobacteria bacterium 64-11]|nr:MAG: PadR family transcriptional regulator [Alphaproteobacteria bacterium 64-11]
MRFSHHGHCGHHHFGRFGRFRGGEFGAPWEMETGGRGRRRVFDSGELRLVLLKLISDQPRHGYDLIRSIEELTGGEYSPSPGIVYPTLTLLQEMGHIREDDTGGGRKTFAITQDGAVFLAQNKTVVEALFERLAALGIERARTDRMPIRRAMGNLRTVLIHRLGREQVSAETLHQITAILDDAAQRIERL